jgi:DNA-binding MarR family transcriptional regulator
MPLHVSQLSEGMPTPDQTTFHGVRTKGNSGWFWANNALLDEYGPIIGALGIAVYTALARFTDHTGQSCYPSYQTIAQRLNLSRGKVIAIIHQLEACGLVRREPRTDEAGNSQLNRYTLLGVEPPIRDEVVHEENQVVHIMHHPVHAVHQGSASGALGVVHTVHPNKTYIEQDLKNRDCATSSTDNTPEPGRDADLDSALPSSGLPQQSEAMHATSPVSPSGETRHTSAAVDDEGDPMNLAAHGSRDDEAFDRGGHPKPQKRRNAQATRASSVPEIFPITEAMRAWAQENLPSVNVERETEQFLDHHRAKGSVFEDWIAAWRTWMRRAASFQEERAESRASSLQANMNSARQKALVL